MFGEPVQTSPTIGVKMRDRSLRGVLLAARASSVIKWDHRSRRFDAPINFGGSGNKSIPGQPYASAKHGRSELKNVGKAPDAGISAFGFRPCNEGSHRGTRQRNVRVFDIDDHLLVRGKFWRRGKSQSTPLQLQRKSAPAQPKCSVTDSSNALIPFQVICTPIQTRKNDDNCVITVIPVAPRICAKRSANP